MIAKEIDNKWIKYGACLELQRGQVIWLNKEKKKYEKWEGIYVCKKVYIKYLKTENR